MIKAFYNEKNSYRKIYISSAVSHGVHSQIPERECNERVTSIYRHMRMENNVCIERYRALEGKIRDDNTEAVDRRVDLKKKN